MRHDWFANSLDDPAAPPLNDSPAHAIAHAWDEVERAGGVRAFLRSCGVTEAQLEAVRGRLVG